MNSDAHHQNKTKIPRNVIALGLVSLFTDAATEMIYPLVPLFVTFLGSTAVILGVIEGVAETTAAMLKLISGIISDKIGKRKPLVLIGYGISTLIRPFTGIVSAAWQIVFIRMTDRVGKGIRTAPRDALIASSVDDHIRGRAYGFHRAMDHTGAVIGPFLALLALGFLVLVYHMQNTLSILRWTFLLSLIPGLFAVLTIVFFVHEKAAPSSASKTMNFSLRQFDRNFIKYLGVIILFTLGNSSDAFLLFRVQEAIHQSQTLYARIYALPFAGNIVRAFGDSEAQKRVIDMLFIPLVWAFFHVIKVIFSTPLGALSDRIGRKIVINIGWAIYAFVYFAFAFLDRLPNHLEVPGTFVLFAVYALYYAFSEGAEKAFVADLVQPGQLGSAFGLYNFAVGLAALPASVVFGVLYYRFGAIAAFGTGAVIACLSMALFGMTIKEPNKHPPQVIEERQ